MKPIAALLLFVAATAAAEDLATNAPVSMARWILSERESTAPYGWGLDVGRAFERFDGLQLGLGAVDVLNGVQIGIVMPAVEARGIQLGALAAASECSAGVQAGLFSMAETSLDGMQAGGVAACIGLGGDKGSKLGNGEPHTPVSHGLQMAILFAMADRFEGVQAAAFQSSAWELDGLQFAFKAEAHELNGLQIGLQTSAHRLSGLQIGVVNAADTLHGLQIGIYNHAHTGTGVQLGLVNGFGPPGDALWLPLVNARF